MRSPPPTGSTNSLLRCWRSAVRSPRGCGSPPIRYREGYSPYLEQLDAQRGLLAAELGVAQARADALSGPRPALSGHGRRMEPREPRRARRRTLKRGRGIHHGRPGCRSLFLDLHAIGEPLLARLAHLCLRTEPVTLMSPKRCGRRNISSPAPWRGSYRRGRCRRIGGQRLVDDDAIGRSLRHADGGRAGGDARWPHRTEPGSSTRRVGAETLNMTAS